ncbi:MAG: 4-phosphoerythronate dehydrogenase, partial [Bacteroidaceae bacterium]
MKVIVDDKIPYIREAIERIASDVIYLPGAKITKADLIDADAMIIRTRTPCDAALLEGTSIQFIATATIGFDHLDTAYLAKAGIPWSNCPGCNASSVGQYVHAAFLVLREQKGLDLAHLTVGIVGMGHVGKEVEKALRPFGCRILRNDPPRQEAEGGDFVSLHTLAEQCNVITFHTPLIFEGLHPTFHLADKEFFASLRHQPVILNAGRGEVVDNRAILYAMDKRLVSEAIIDTWENEPHVVTPLLERAFLATPHIAGYSADGKA